MTVETDIARIREQEAALVFERFDEGDAFRLGLWLRERAVADSLPIVVDIRTWDRQLFYCAMPGSSGSNENWVRRKVNVVKMFSNSTYLIGRQQNTADGLLPSRQGLDPAEYVAAGGGFPIRLSNAGVIGAVTVSGLPQRLDHGLVVEALCVHLGLDHESLALPES